MVRAWIGLGANLGRPEHSLGMALTALDALPKTRLLAVSTAYWTAPWGVPDQAEYLNAVALIETTLEPVALLRALLAVESRLGRRRNGERWGPREIDLDLLVFDNQVLESEELTLPHPRLHERAFVLVPLAELSPELEIPGQGPVLELLESLPEDELAGVRPAKPI